MHSLFWKIFVSFWSALILFTLATVLTATFLVEKKREQRLELSPHAYLQQLADQAQDIADQKGEAGLKRWLLRLDRHEAVPFLLVDENGRELLGRPVPDHLEHMFDRASRLTKNRAHHRLRHVLPVVRLPNGTQHRLVPDFHNITLGRVLVRPRVIALPLLLAGLISVVVCLLLARYLTRPLTRLHHATEEYAHGNLETRVSPALGRRKDEIADLARSFDYMAERLDGLLRSHKQLLRDVSHELRSPLARMQVALELARVRSGTTAEKELNRIALEAERLDELIGQLLSLARLEAQERPMMCEAVDLEALLSEVIEDARFEAQAQDRDLTLTMSERLCVDGDPRLLHSALENIVRNALRHTAAQTAVELSLQRDSNEPSFLRLAIRDHGPGVTDEILPKLFEPFVRADSARSRDQGGHGLGLAIAERVTRFHGGTLSAENVPSGGLQISLRLPIKYTRSV